MIDLDDSFIVDLAKHLSKYPKEETDVLIVNFGELIDKLRTKE